MKRYNKVLLAVDFYSDNTSVIAKASQLSKDHQASLHIVHVCEALNAVYAVEGIAVWGGQLASLDASIRNQARAQLDEMAQQLDIAPDNRFLLLGNPADNIHQLVDQHSIDVIVLGSHGKHGLKLLLGSTASSVLHGASCDVLAVRLKQDNY